VAIGTRAERVARGIDYLNLNYPGWFNRVDRTELDMKDESKHVLCYAAGVANFGYTVESEWPYTFLVKHGFADNFDTAAYTLLTAEWSFQLRTKYTGRQ